MVPFTKTQAKRQKRMSRRRLLSSRLHRLRDLQCRLKTFPSPHYKKRLRPPQPDGMERYREFEWYVNPILLRLHERWEREIARSHWQWSWRATLRRKSMRADIAWGDTTHYRFSKSGRSRERRELREALAYRIDDQELEDYDLKQVVMGIWWEWQEENVDLAVDTWYESRNWTLAARKG